MKPILKKVTPSPETSLNVRRDTGKNLLNNWHYHPELELLYVKGSSGTRIVGDHMEPFNLFDLVLLGPDLPHTYNHDSDYIHRRGDLAPEAIVVHFQKDFAGPDFWNLPEMQKIRELIKLSRQGLKLMGKTKRNIAALMQRIMIASPPERVILLIQMLEMISASREYLLLASKGYNYSANYLDNDKISAIYQYTCANFAKKIKTEELASLLRISPQSFCRYFKQKTTKTFVEFLIEIRIGHACRMLQDNDLQVAEVSYACGYNNVSHFNHQFKKITGKTPIQYRSEHNDNLRKIDHLKYA